MGTKIILVQVDHSQNHQHRRILEISWVVEENYLSQCSGWEDEQRKVEDGKHVDAAEQPEEEEEEEEGYHQLRQEETPEVADLQDQGGEEVGEGAGGVGEKPVEGEEGEGEEGVTQEEVVHVEPEEELGSHQVEKHLLGSLLDCVQTMNHENTNQCGFYQIHNCDDFFQTG